MISRLFCLGCVGLLVAACTEDTPIERALALGADTPDVIEPDNGDIEDAAADSAVPASTVVPLRPRANPSEYVGFRVELPVTPAEFRQVAGPLLGAEAAAGAGHRNFVVQNGVLLTSEVDPRTPSQLVVTVGMETTTGAEPAMRTAARLPASTAYGQLWYDTVDVAIETAQRKLDAGETMETFRIEYRTRSAQGGAFVVAYDFDGSNGKLVFTSRGPRTSLLPDRINLPALDGQPYETVYGLVNFQVDRAEFDFFVNRAYGISAGAAQNFNDFYLLPHEWLRLTVTPELDDQRIDVGFEVVTRDGRRIPVSRAPASMLAGEQFMQTVFRMIENMEAGEIAAPGSGTTWEVPFYYDDPEGGGVVEVIATGAEGVMRIAYAVESPAKVLEDVAFVGYEGSIEVPPDWDRVDPGCAELGSREAAQGFFNMRFQASSTVRRSLENPQTIRGNIWGSIYRDSDVRITGPLDGAQAVASFALQDVVIAADGSVDTYRIDTPMLAGKYQVLGFLDINNNADPDDAGPDEGDPVMIPIGGFTMRCAEQPITAEFAILLPPGR